MASLQSRSSNKTSGNAAKVRRCIIKIIISAIISVLSGCRNGLGFQTPLERTAKKKREKSEKIQSPHGFKQNKIQLKIGAPMIERMFFCWDVFATGLKVKTYRAGTPEIHPPHPPPPPCGMKAKILRCL